MEIENMPIKKKVTIAVKSSPLDDLIADDMEKCPECDLPMSECECDEEEETDGGEGMPVDIKKLLSALGVKLPGAAE